MKKLFVALLTATSFAHAGVITDLESWGVNVTEINKADNVAASYYSTDPSLNIFSTVEDRVFSKNGQHDWVGPGRGGQRYDLEALYVKQSGSILTVAGITGALWNNRGASNFGIGDLFIGSRDSSGQFYGYGIELTGATYLMNSAGSTVASVAAPLGSLWEVSAGVGYADGIALARNNDPYGAPGQLIYNSLGDGFNDGTAEHPATFVATNFAQIQWQQFSGNRHSAFMMTFDLANIPTIADAWKNDMLLHWGEVCTNDYLEVSVTNTVPTPASGLLVGIGLILAILFS